MGALVLARPALWTPLAAAAARLGDRIGPDRWYVLGLRALNQASTGSTSSRFAIFVPGWPPWVPAGVLVAFGIAATSTRGAYVVGRSGWRTFLWPCP
jgi:hypothetical protein